MHSAKTTLRLTLVVTPVSLVLNSVRNAVYLVP
jgi:hypothetical protein